MLIEYQMSDVALSSFFSETDAFALRNKPNSMLLEYQMSDVALSSLFSETNTFAL